MTKARLSEAKPVLTSASGARKEAAVIDPYEDWEETTRPSWLKDRLQSAECAFEAWKPVYVELTEGNDSYVGSARKLLKITEKKNAAIIADASRLERICAETDMNRRLALVRMFVFRVEKDAYETKGMPFVILKVGPMMPRRMVPGQEARSWHPNGCRKNPPRRAAQKPAPVLTGIVDDFFGIANARFRSSETTTRIRHCWFQNAVLAQDGPVDGDATGTIGFELGKADIDKRLDDAPDEKTFYDKLFRNGSPVQEAPGAEFPNGWDILDPKFTGSIGSNATHGTFVADLAAGWPPGDPTGMQRPVAVVQLPQQASAETWGGRLDVFVILALMKLIQWADDFCEDETAPDDAERGASLVVNMSYAVHAGDKDGSDFLVSEIERLIELRNRIYQGTNIQTRVILPSGNNFRARGRASLIVPPRSSRHVDWMIPPDDQSVSFLEITVRHKGGARLTIEHPLVETTPIEFSGSSFVKDLQADGTVIGRIYVKCRTPVDDLLRTSITIALCPTLNNDDPELVVPAGKYGIRLTNRHGRRALRCTAEIQRDDSPRNYPPFGRQSYLDGPEFDAIDPETQNYEMPRGGAVTRDGTLSPYATGPESFEGTIVVGAAYDRDTLANDGMAGYLPAQYSSAGPVASGRRGPDLSAIAEETRATPGRIASGTFSGSAAIFQGTSVAVPLVTRSVVERLAAGEPISRFGRGGVRHPRLGFEIIAMESEAGPTDRKIVRRREPKT